MFWNLWSKVSKMYSEMDTSSGKSDSGSTDSDVEEKMDELRIILEKQEMKLGIIEDSLKEIESELGRSRRLFSMYFIDPIVERFEHNEQAIEKLANETKSNSTAYAINSRELNQKVKKTENRLGLIEKKVDMLFELMDRRLKKIKELFDERTVIASSLNRLRKSKKIDKKLLDELV